MPITFETLVASAADNGKTIGGYWVADDGWIQVGVSSSSVYQIWLRFAGINIPRGVTVSEAYVQFVRTASYGSNVYTNIGVVNEDNHAAPTNDSTWTADNALLTGLVAWDIATPSGSGTVNTSSFHTGLTTVFARSGWNPGQAIGIQINDDGTASPDNYQEVASYNHASVQPRLHVVYTFTPLQTVTFDDPNILVEWS